MVVTSNQDFQQSLQRLDRAGTVSIENEAGTTVAYLLKPSDYEKLRYKQIDQLINEEELDRSRAEGGKVTTDEFLKLFDE
jgi:hypothetical protein